MIRVLGLTDRVRVCQRTALPPTLAPRRLVVLGEIVDRRADTREEVARAAVRCVTCTHASQVVTQCSRERNRRTFTDVQSNVFVIKKSYIQIIHPQWRSPNRN